MISDKATCSIVHLDCPNISLLAWPCIRCDTIDLYRLMPEVLGVAAVCIEGRKRRHLGTICMCGLICSNASQSLMEPQRLATALALGLRTVGERADYEVTMHTDLRRPQRGSEMLVLGLSSSYCARAVHSAESGGKALCQSV